MAFAPRGWRSLQRAEHDHADRRAGRRGRSAARVLGAGLLAVGLFALAVPVLPAGAATCPESAGEPEVGGHARIVAGRPGRSRTSV